MKDFTTNIRKVTKAVSRQGFGLILLLDMEHEVPYTICGSMAEVGEVVPVGSKAYQIAGRIFAQKPRPEKLAIAGSTQKEFVAGTKGKYTLTIATEFTDGDIISVNGVKYTCRASGAVAEKNEFNSGTKQVEAQVLKELIEKNETSFSLSTTADTVVFTQKIAAVGEMPFVEVTGSGKANIVKTISGEKDKGMIALLTETAQKHKDFFFLVSTENANEDIRQLSAWIDTQEKMYFVTSQSLLTPKLLASEQTVVMYHDKNNAYVAEGLAAYLATAKIGGVTAKFKTIAGVSEAQISETELEELHKNNGFTYLEKMGILQTSEGKTTSGEYIDIVLGSFWIKVTMDAAMASLAAQTEKINFGNDGIAKMVAVCKSVLNRAAEDQGIIEKDENGKGVFEVNYLPKEKVDGNDIANRRYHHVTWTAKLAGAIHTGIINGTLEY